MRHQGSFSSITPRLQQLTTILGMLDDLGRVSRILDHDIAIEEHKEPGSPLVASLTLRRAKLRETISTLETRLESLRAFRIA